MMGAAEIRARLLADADRHRERMEATTNQLVVAAEQNAEDATVMRSAIIEALEVHERSQIMAAEMEASAMLLDDATDREAALQAADEFRRRVGDAMADTLRGRTYQRGHSGALMRDDGVANGIRLETLTERLADGD